VDGDGPGLFVIIVGLVLAIAAVRGTVKKVLQDISGSAPGSTSTSNAGNGLPGSVNVPHPQNGYCASQSNPDTPLPGNLTQAQCSAQGGQWILGVSSFSNVTTADPVMTNGTAPIF
jgi:hypothetical protein